MTTTDNAAQPEPPVTQAEIEAVTIEGLPALIAAMLTRGVDSAGVLTDPTPDPETPVTP